MVSGMLVILAAVTGIATGKEIALGLAELPVGIGAGLGSGWLLWRGGSGWRAFAAALFSFGAFAIIVGLTELLSGRVPVVYFLMMELRFGIPALLVGGLLWRGARAGLTLAVVIGS